MKILQIINNLGSGGAEKLIYDYVPKMKELGYDVDILILQEKNSTYSEELRKKGINVFSLSKNSMKSFFNIFKMRNYIKKNGYNIIHSHIFPSLYFVGFSTIFLKNIKLVHTEHSTSNNRRKYKIFKIIEKFIYSRFNKIICISKKTEENLREHINDFSNKILTIENGIDLEKFKNASPIERKNIHKSLEEEDILITMVGRFSPQKDQSTLVKAVKLLPENYKLLLVGEGKLKEKIEQEVKELKLEHKVFFLGLRRDVEKILKTSNISILSSVWEGFGLVAVESMAVGTPVVGTNVDGLREVIKDENYLFEVGNVKELVKKIRIVTKRNDKEKLAKYLKNNSEKYSIDNMIEKYLLCYKGKI